MRAWCVCGVKRIGSPLTLFSHPPPPASHPGLQPPTGDAVLAAELSIMEVLASRGGLLVFSPYGDAARFAAAAAKAAAARAGANAADAAAAALAPAAWACVTASLRTDVCLWAPPHVIALAAVVLAAGAGGGSAPVAGGDAPPAAPPPPLDLAPWLASLDVDLDAVVTVAADVACAVGAAGGGGDADSAARAFEAVRGAAG